MLLYELLIRCSEFKCGAFWSNRELKLGLSGMENPNPVLVWVEDDSMMVIWYGGNVNNNNWEQLVGDDGNK